MNLVEGADEMVFVVMYVYGAAGDSWWAEVLLVG